MKSLFEDLKHTLADQAKFRAEGKVTRTSKSAKDPLMFKTFPGQVFYSKATDQYAITRSHGGRLRVLTVNKLSPTQERQFAAGLIVMWLRSLL